MKAGYKSKFEQAWTHWERTHPGNASRPTVDEALRISASLRQQMRAAASQGPQTDASTGQQPANAGTGQQPANGGGSQPAPSSGAPPPADLDEPQAKCPGTESGGQPASQAPAEGPNPPAEGGAAKVEEAASGGQATAPKPPGGRKRPRSQGSEPSQTQTPGKGGGKRQRADTPSRGATPNKGAEEIPPDETAEQKKARQAAKRDAARAAQKTIDDAQNSLGLMAQALSQAEFIIDAIKKDPTWSWAPHSKAEARMIEAKKELELLASPGSFIRDAMMMDLDNLKATKGEDVFEMNMASMPGMLDTKVTLLKNALQRMNDLHALHMDD